MQFQTVAYTEKDGILHIKLNRPEKRNAVNQQLISDVQQCFAEVATQPGVQVVLLSGEGKGFSAGTDLTSFQAGGDNQDLRRFVRRFQSMFNEIELLEKPVIALIHNFCYGAALELAAACDLRICTPDATFNIPEVNMGMVPDGGGSQRLPRIIGVGRAKELILTGKTINAQTADKWGLVNEIVNLEDLEKTGIAWANEIMRNGMVSVGLAKRNVDMTYNMAISDALECAGLAQSVAFSDPSFLKRIEQRFLEKVKGKKP
ncbi:MAG: enoyl-CoA hydratase/isomerase family protein [Dehalococcoidia bacterium]|nr:enoyl-CoA hydratase/isomerase family protein [Dehalococcoidia bacterium]MDD5494296.1 enoyl-CoA hydratase/isomerase family protein [Dehalococcoidia bacterium]